MRILQKDNRLPFTPVTPAQWRFILKLEAYLLEKNGFKALKLIGYRGATSFEGGWPKHPVNPQAGAAGKGTHPLDAEYGQAALGAVGNGVGSISATICIRPCIDA